MVEDLEGLEVIINNVIVADYNSGQSIAQVPGKSVKTGFKCSTKRNVRFVRKKCPTQDIFVQQRA